MSDAGQTLASGRVSAQERAAKKYVPTGATGSRPVAANEMTLLLMGAPKLAGKTHFLLTRPDLFIISTDNSPTSNPNPVAEVWPDRAEEMPWLTWTMMRAEITRILAARRDQLKGAPGAIAFDSYGTLLPMARRSAAAYLLKMEEEQVTPEDISYVGQGGWGLAYDNIDFEIARVRAAGLGCILVCHIGDTTVEHRGVTEIRTEPTLTDKQHRRLYGMCDASLLCTTRPDVELREVVKQITVAGKPREKRTTEKIPIRRKVICTQNDDLKKWLGVRVDRPEKLPAHIDCTARGWADFAEAWDRAFGIID